MDSIRTRLGILLVAAAVALTSCSGDSEADPAQPDGGTGRDAPAAEWTEIDVGRDALPDAAVTSVLGTARAQGDLPPILVGAITDPGGASRAVVWKRGSGLEEPTVLDVGGTDAWAYDVVTEGATTIVRGASWHEGRTVPFIVESTDRVRWTSVPLPDTLTDGDVAVGAVVAQGDRRVTIGIDAEQRPVAVDVASGRVVRLGGDPSLRYSEIVAAVALRKRISVLVDGQRPDGGEVTVAFHSDDAASWTADGALPGREAEIAGAVATSSGILATGSQLEGTDPRAAAWLSTDGHRWRVDPVPSFPDAVTGWSTRLGEPKKSGDAVAVPMMYGEQLYARLLSRVGPGDGGPWRDLGTTPPWEGPDADVMIEPHGDGFTVVRSGYGDLDLGHRFPTGAWQTLDEADVAHEPVTWWESVAVAGDRPVLVGGTSDPFVESADYWSMSTDLTAFTVRNDRLTGGPWVPRTSEGLLGTRTVSAPDGSSVVLGEREFQDPPTEADQTGLVGWFRPADGRWQPVAGLAGPRTEFLTGVRHHDGEWVATGTDRDSFVGSDHTRAAVWTSRDGRHWQREVGPFDVASDLDSWAYDSCPLPDGDLLVVGGVEDRDVGYRGLTFRRSSDRWSRFPLAGLGKGVTGVHSCVGTDEATLIQGSGHRHDQWVTTDGRTFTPVAIGSDQDYVGTVVALEGGFVAPGGVFTGGQSRPVLWLSTDGRGWTEVEVPVDHPLLPTDVAVWGDRLLVALTGEAGPDVRVLENVDELLADLPDR